MRFVSLFKTILFAVILPLAVSAMEIRPAAGFLTPAKVSIENHNHGVLSEKTPKSEFTFQGDLEFLFSAQYAPIRYGIGLGYKSRQNKGDVEYTPAALPLWFNLTFGSIFDDSFIAPYAVTRLGYVAPLNFDDPWWEKPTNFMIYIGAGCVLPYRISLEIGYDYTSILKSFESKKQTFRISSGRLEARLSIGFELSHERNQNRIILRRNNVEDEDEFEDIETKPIDNASFEESLQNFEDSLATVNGTPKTQEEPYQAPQPAVQENRSVNMETPSEITESSAKKRKAKVKSKKTSRKRK